MKKFNFWILITLVLLFSGCSNSSSVDENNLKGDELSESGKKEMEWYTGQWISSSSPHFVMKIDSNDVMITQAMTGDIETTETTAKYNESDENNIIFLLEDKEVRELFPHLFENEGFASAKGFIARTDVLKDLLGQEAMAIDENRITLAVSPKYDDGSSPEKALTFDFNRYEDDDSENFEEENKNYEEDETDMYEDDGVNSEEKTRDYKDDEGVDEEKTDSYENVSDDEYYDEFDNEKEYDYNGNGEDDDPTQEELKDFAYNYDTEDYSLDVEDGVIVIIDFISDEEDHTNDDTEQIKKNIEFTENVSNEVSNEFVNGIPVILQESFEEEDLVAFKDGAPVDSNSTYSEALSDLGFDWGETGGLADEQLKDSE